MFEAVSTYFSKWKFVINIVEMYKNINKLVGIK